MDLTITRRKLALDKARELVQRVRLQHPAENAESHLAEITFSLRRAGFQASYAALVFEAASMKLGLGRQVPPNGDPPLYGMPVSLSHSLNLRPYPPQIASRFPSLFTKFESNRPCIPPATSPSPAALVTLFGSTVRSFQQPQTAGANDVDRFELLRRRRRRRLTREIGEGGRYPKPQWNAPIEGDIAIGPLRLPNGTPNPNIRSAGLSNVDWGLLTTFPVSGPVLELHGKSRDGRAFCLFRLLAALLLRSVLQRSSILTSVLADPIWNSTAKKITTFQQHLLPVAAQSMLWTDSNPSWRGGGLGTNAKDPATLYSFAQTLPMLATLNLKILVVAQAGNRAMLVSKILPSHVRLDISPVVPSSFQRSAEDYDDSWCWAEEEETLDPREWRLINGAEIILYLHLNVMDAQIYLPYQPLATFVRQFRGGRSILFLFSPHPCNLDPWQYSRSNFGAAAEETERVMLTVEALKTGVCAPRPQPPFLRNLFRPVELNEVWLRSATGGGTLTTCIAIRREEQQRGEAYSPTVFAPSLISLAALHLCRSDDERLVYSYTPHLNPHFPPSVIGDLVHLWSTMNLAGLAKREDEAHAGTLVPGEFQYDVLTDARESGIWRERLEELGVEELFFVQEKQFSRGLALKEHTLHAISTDSLRRYAFSSATPGAELFFSFHSIAHYTDPLALVRGVLSTVDRTASVTVSVRTASNTKVIKRLPTTHACEDCAEWGATQCVYSYRQAVESGIVLEAAGGEEVVRSLESWLAVLDSFAIGGRSAWTTQDKEEFRDELEQTLELAKQWMALDRN